MPLTDAQRRSAKRFVLATVFVYALGFGIIIPVLPQLIMQLEGISLSRATLIGGYLAASYALWQFLLGPMIGNLGDRFGRRPVLLLSLFGFSIDYALMGFAPNILWLFLGRSVAGGLGAIFGPANAAMADMSNEQDRARNFGLVGAAFGIGFTLGPALGGLVADLGLRLPFFIAAGLALANGIYGLFVFQETLPETKRRPLEWRRANPLGALNNLRRYPAMAAMALAYLLWMTSSGIYPAAWAYFAPAQYGWDTRFVGYSLALVGISMAFFQARIIGPAVARFGERRVAFYGIMGGIGGFAVYMLSANGTLGLIVCAFVGIQGMTMPSLNAMMSRRMPADAQGELQGVIGSLSALSALISPLLYNSVLAEFTRPDRTNTFPGAPFGLAIFIALLTLLLVWRLPDSAKQQTH